MGLLFTRPDPVTIPPPATSAIGNSITPSFSYNFGNVPATHPTPVRFCPKT